MSIDAVTSRIDQILAMQQQILDPSAAASSSSATSTTSAGSSLGATAGTAGAAGTGATSFSDALSSALGTDSTSSALTSALSPDSLMASAIGDDSDDDGSADSTSALTPDLSTLLGATNSLGLTAGSSLAGTTGTTGTIGTTGATGSATAQVQSMTNMANSLVGKPYVYGGGHSGWGPQSGYDCSGFVSAVLHAGGYLSQPVDTVTLPQQAGMESGPGQYVTVYDRALPGENGHVIIDINGQFYESGGSHGSWGGGGGVEKIGTPSAAYLATFPTVLHPAGL
jgi:cell wall-associated NlpC family hydrolase